MAEERGSILSAFSDDLAGAVERASRALVTVDARRRLPATGIVWEGPSGSGVVVTASHVVEREEDIAVILPDGQKQDATLAGRDPGSDIAVLRLGAPAAPAEVAPSGTLKVGHLVVALGRPGPGALEASFGIVSSLGGPWRSARGGIVEGYIRADVTLYPGFSGGALIDVQGRVVGLNSSHLAGGQSIAIPAATVGTIVEALLTRGHVRRAYLGVSSQPVPLPTGLRQQAGLQQETGLMILGVESGSPAERGGILLGDILVAFAGQTVADGNDLQAALGSDVVGKTVSATVLRGGKRQDLSLTPGERPS